MLMIKKRKQWFDFDAGREAHKTDWWVAGLTLSKTVDSSLIFLH